MKVIVVGGTGTIGRAVVQALAKQHEVIVAGRSNGDVKVDIKKMESVKEMYEKVKQFDAVVSTVGKVDFDHITKLTPERFYVGLDDKLMGQVNLVLAGLSMINENGSFTLTSGILSHDPIRYGSSAAMVNGAIDAFVRGAAIEMSRGIRINVVNPSVIEESRETYGDYFPGFEFVSVSRVAQAYVKSVNGAQTGQVYKVW